jgi:hypothetical protein
MSSTNTYIKQKSFYVYAYLRSKDSKTAKQELRITSEKDPVIEHTQSTKK